HRVRGVSIKLSDQGQQTRRPARPPQYSRVANPQKTQPRRGCIRDSNCGAAEARGAGGSPAKDCARRVGLGPSRHQARGAEEGQRWKTHATEASEKLDTAAGYSADAAAG